MTFAELPNHPLLLGPCSYDTGFTLYRIRKLILYGKPTLFTGYRINVSDSFSVFSRALALCPTLCTTNMVAMQKERDIFFFRLVGKSNCFLGALRRLLPCVFTKARTGKGSSQNNDKIGVIFVERHPKVDDEENVEESFDHVCKCCHHRKENFH